MSRQNSFLTSINKGVNKFGNIFAGLKALPTIAFALMLGAGVVVTAFAVWFTSIIDNKKWPLEVAAILAQGVVNALYIALGLIGLVIFVLAFGRIERLNFTTPAGVSGGIEFDDTPTPPVTTTVVQQTTQIQTTEQAPIVTDPPKTA